MTGNRSGMGAVLAAMLTLTAGGCVGMIAEEEPSAPVGLGCVDDSKHCIEQRAAALNQLMSDPTRKWIREPSSQAAYASGVRMYAFKQKKRELSCDELAVGKREADAAPTVLRGTPGTLTPAQVSRGVMFAGEVGRELESERKRRCKA